MRVLVDVRLTPLSRKPGLSKTKLSEARRRGHRLRAPPALGNPKDNRARFRAGEPESRARYRDVLETAAATDALHHVSELLDGGVVALAVLRAGLRGYLLLYFRTTLSLGC